MNPFRTGLFGMPGVPATKEPADESKENKGGSKNRTTIFFLGAGASVKAGVPATREFANEFKENIEKKSEILRKIKEKYKGISVESLLKAIYEPYSKSENTLNNSEIELLKKEMDQFSHEKIISRTQETIKPNTVITEMLAEKFEESIERKATVLKKLWEILKDEYEEPIDVEILLEALHELNNGSEYVLPKLSELTEKLKGYSRELKSLEKELKWFIREKTIVDVDDISYLSPLKDFVEEYKPLDIVSLNYDTTIEQFCEKHNLRYTDGFDLYWKPELFESEDYAIRYYKLHGSIIWYKTNRNRYIKVPISSEKVDEIELITKENAETLMVYPLPGKSLYTEPTSNLLPLLHKKLENADVCIVVGYRFRDSNIRDTFFEAAQKALQDNRELTLILIDPHAGKIYDDKLKFSDNDKKIHSSLKGKVICFNYPFENVLKGGYLYRCINKLSEIKGSHAEANKTRRDGKSYVHIYESSLEECVLKCIEIGHVSMAEEILEKELDITIDNLKESPRFMRSNGRGYFNKKLRVYMGLGVNHLLSGHHDKAKQYFQGLKDVLEQALEIGKKYFTLNNELHELNNKEQKSDENNQKIGEINKELNDFRRRYENLPFYEWFMSNGGYLSSDFCEFLNTQRGLRSKEKDDEINDTFSKIIEQCDEMKKCVSSYGKYNDSKEIRIYGGTTVKVGQKEDLEKKLVEIIGSIDKLIALCDKKN